MTVTLNNVRERGDYTSQLSFLVQEVRRSAVDEATALGYASELKWPASMVQALRDGIYAGTFGGERGYTTQRRPLPRSTPAFGAGEFQPSAAAEGVRREVDKHLAAIGNATRFGPAASKTAVRALTDYMASVGEDAISAIGFGSDPANRGLGYINSRLRLAGLDSVLEPIMDACSRAAMRAAQRGDVRGTKGELSIKFHAFDQGVRDCLRRVGGVDYPGKWAVKLAGEEAFGQRVSLQDGSVSAQRRDFSEAVEGMDLREAIEGLISGSLDRERFPDGYTLNVNLNDIDEPARSQARAALSGLEAKGFTLRYYETDTNKIMDAIRAGNDVDRQVEAFLQEAGADPQKWTPAQYERYRALHAAYHAKPTAIFEDGKGY